jgi:ribosomal protein S18 acetylase RimI-like enzyme
MSVTYRNVTLDDAATIADLFARSFVETFAHLYAQADLDAFLAGVTPQAFAEEIGSPHFALRIAEADGEPVGFAKLGPAELPVETPPGTLELRQIYVLKPWQGQGIAQELYEWAESEARARSARHLQLTVYIDNHRARRFYDRRGFVPVGRYDFMVGSQADHDIVMRKAL